MLIVTVDNSIIMSMKDNPKTEVKFTVNMQNSPHSLPLWNRSKSTPAKNHPCSQIFVSLFLSFLQFHYHDYGAPQGYLGTDTTIFNNPEFEHFTKRNFPPNKGLEPLTLRLKVWCSTDWANRAHVQEQYSNLNYFNFDNSLQWNSSFHCFDAEMFFRWL